MPNRQLTIEVPKMSGPGSEKRNFVWNQSLIVDSDSGEKVLSTRLFGYESVIGILRSAFANGLSRDVAWDISNIDPYLHKPLLAAAKVYKRGVRVLGVDDVSTASTYEIQFFDDLMSTFAFSSSRELVIVDRRVSEFWWNQIPNGLNVVDFDEERKDLTAVADIMNIVRRQEKSPKNIVVVGGGVAGDVVGFASGLLGLPCRFVPTTLLSMVDSSIGGKVGVNFEQWGKNQVGLFNPPISVNLCTRWLETLPLTEIKSGMVEALKHAALAGDQMLWNSLMAISRSARWQDVRGLIPSVLEIKANVVARDPFEAGERAVLNFGHTLGHAVETMLNRRQLRVSHGACVALGMFHALRVSSEIYGFDAGQYTKDLIEANLIPDRDILNLITGMSDDEFSKLLVSDKKNLFGSNYVGFVLLSGWGHLARSEDGGWLVKIPMDLALKQIRESFRLLV